jgi:hypothetical protein
MHKKMHMIAMFATVFLNLMTSMAAAFNGANCFK